MEIKNFKELAEKKYSIEIPIIQRDYVQGRDSEKAKEVRKSFLDDIFAALEKNEKFHLDFVYGSLEDNKFIPIDGQQRLTTLLLLHWYFSKKKGEDFFIDFIYKTRVSSSEFCDILFNFKIDFSKDSIKEQILNTKEFNPFWEDDPTVKSMLVMIDEIHKRGKRNDFFDSLNKFSFEVFRLEDFGKEQSEELYRKMNSRGKSLTAFENCKTIIEQIVYKTKGKENYRKIAKKFEKEWADNFWDDYKDESLLIDDSFINFIYFITEMLSFENGNEEDNIQSFSYLKKFYKDSSNLEFLEKALDRFKEIEKISNELEDEFIFFEKKEKVNLLKEVILYYSPKEKARQVSISNRILLYMLIKSLDYPTEINSLLRIVRNILYRDRALKTGKIEYTSTIKYSDITNYLKQFNKIVSNDCYSKILNEDFKFRKDDFSHEKEKVIFLNQNPSLKDKLFSLERFKYLKGDLKLFFDKRFTFKSLEDRLIYISDNIDNIFKNKDDVIIRSLLSIKNTERNKHYSLWIGSVYGGGKYFLGQKDKWEIFFTFNNESKNNIDFYSNFFTQYEVSNNLNDIISARLKEYKVLKKDWIYYFIKYPIITKVESKDKFSNVMGWFDYDENDVIEKLENEKRITSWHTNTYLLALLDATGRKIEKKYLNINENTGESFLKINNKKIKIKNNSIHYNKIEYPLFENNDVIEIVKNLI